MILDGHAALLQHSFLASSLIGIILLILSLAIVRGKRTLDASVTPLQLIALGMLLFISLQLPLVAQVIDSQLRTIATICTLAIWLFGTSLFLSRQLPLVLGKLVSFAATSIWGVAVFTIGNLLIKEAGRTPEAKISLINQVTLLPLLAIGALSLLALLIPRRTPARRLKGAMTGNIVMSFAYIAASLAVLSFHFDKHLIAIPVISDILSSHELLDLYGHHLISGSFIVASLLVFLSALHLPSQLNISFSRNATLYSVITIFFALFIALMWALGAYTSRTSPTNSASIEVFLILLTSVGASYIALSTSFRSKLRVAIDKHFFRHKYDYRRVWLELIQTLSRIEDDKDFFTHSLRAVARIFAASGGALWLRDNNQHFTLCSQWEIGDELPKMVDHDQEFLEPFYEEGWIYALNKSGEQQHDRHQKKLPDWISSLEDIWIVAPLLRGEETVGFFLLQKKQNNQILIWEDIDVLKSAGKQLASHISSQLAAEELAESRQFDTYNKLTAFIMHDLKNLIAQQALVVENAKKHKENPAFVEDAVRTIDNSVKRMNQLLKRLQSNSQSAVQRSVLVNELVTDAIRKSADRAPIPTLRGESKKIAVVADRDQITTVFQHVIRNAQDATSADGFIDVTLTESNGYAAIEIEDNGCGMDAAFVQNRLFKPFDSTKSSMGMGIGAYQVKEFIEQMGGMISISSQINIGTSVTIKLPIFNTEKPAERL